MKRLLTALLCMLPTLLMGQGNERFKVPEGYLIIARSEYREMLQPLVENRFQEGYAVEEFYVDTSDCTWIHDVLQHQYDQATALHPFARYILLVGDVKQLSPFEGRHKPADIPTWHQTDLYYGEFTGDYVPESFVGRLPARDTSEVRRMVENILRYEQQQVDDPSYLRRALLVAGKENQRPAPTATNGTLNYFKVHLKQHDPEMDTTCYYNPDSDTLLEEIEAKLREGCGLVYFTGHGTSEGWVHPYLTHNILDTLSLPAPALYINNACNTEKLQNDCMGKHLMRRERCGAIGFIGASNEALWNEDFYWSVGARINLTMQPQFNPNQMGAIDHLVGKGGPAQRVTLGSIMHNGGEAVSQSGSPHDAFYWEIYNLMGDPALMPYLGIAEPLALAAPDTVMNWASEIRVSTLPYAQVAATAHSELLGVAIADSNGHCIIPLTISDKKATHYTLKATLNNHKPVVKEVAVKKPQMARLAVVATTLSYPTPLSDNDTLTLQLEVRNMGENRAIQHELSLIEGANTWRLPIGDLAADSVCRMVLHIPYHFDTNQLWKSVIELRDTVEHYSSIPLCYDLPHPYPTIDSYQIIENEASTRKLEPNSQYTLQMVIYNPLRNACRLEIGGESFGVAPTHTDTLLFEFVTPDASLHHYVLQPTLTVLGEQAIAMPIDTSWWILGDAIEGFELGTMGAYPWDSANSISPWHSDNGYHKEGGYSARSGVINGRQTSRLRINIDVNGEDSLSFWVRTSSEGNYDRLNFFIDGEKKSYWSGEGGWRQWQCAISKGLHQLMWEYIKDDSGNEGNDCVWIDKIAFPLCRWDGAYGFFEDDSISIRTVATESKSDKMTIYPNPAHDIIDINIMDGGPGKLLIYNQQGMLVDWRTIEPSEKNIPQTTQYSTAHLRSGIYLIVFENKTNISSEKLIVIH